MVFLIPNALYAFGGLSNSGFSNYLKEGSVSDKLYKLCQGAILDQWFRLAEGSPAESLEKYSMSRFLFLAERASRLKFYGDIFKNKNIHYNQFKIPSDLSVLPIVRKSDLRSRQEDDYIDFELGKLRGYWVRTSGSAGEPFRVMKDRKYRFQMNAFNFYVYSWYGIDPRVRKVNFVTPWGRSSFPWSDLKNSKNLSVADFQHKLGDYADFLQSFKPTVVEANPSYLVSLARFLAEKNKKINVPYIMSYGEQLFPEERKLLSEVFSSEVINRYGLTEMTDIGTECPSRSGFHVNSLGCFVEIVDDNGRPVANGDMGEIVITSFVNEVTPILRYGSGDRGWWIKKGCPCGRSYLLFQVDGRRNDFLALPNGRIIYSSFIHSIFYKKMAKVRQFRVIQENYDTIKILVVPAPDFVDKDKRDILSDFKALLGGAVKASLYKVDQINWEKGGKYKSIMRLCA